MQRGRKTAIYVQYTRPAVYPPLERSAILFADAGWDVCFLGIELEGDPSSLQLIRYPGVREELQASGPTGWRRRLRYPAFVLWCIKEILLRKPDLVYCSDIASYPVGLLASWLSPARVVLHEHDPPPVTWVDNHKLLGRVRSLFARRAALCIVPQTSRATDFANVTRASRIMIAFNCPLIRELPKQEADLSDRRNGMTLWYHGSLSPGQLPLALLDAMKISPEAVRLRFAGYQTVSNPNFVATFLSRADELEISERVEYVGAVPDRRELLKEASLADVGVALFASSFRDPMVGASNKPFDYLGCGLALLTNATPEWSEFFGKRGVAIGCVPECVSDMARALTWLHDHPEHRAEMGRLGRVLIEHEWNYERQFGPVLDVLQRGEVALASLEGGRRASPG